MTAMQNRPLAGVRVLDLTQFLSGPYCSQIFGDLGAEVIKVESPEGDLARSIPPHFVGDDSVYYLSINRNKRSVVANLKSKEGLEIVRKLALASDIVLENFRPGVLDRLGLKASELRAEKPDLIWCSISGFGQTGPYRDKPAYDMIVQALSGGMSLTGERGGAAVRAGIPIGDLAAGMYAAIAILAAFNRRTLTGRGDTIDISMLDCQAAMLCYQGAYHLHSGVVPSRQGSSHDSIATYRSFLCANETQIVITANTERMWQGVCRVLGQQELIDDPRFLSGKERHANQKELYAIIEPAFREKTAAEWVPLLEAEGIPVAVVNTLDRVVSDPQIEQREMVQTLSHDGKTIRIMNDPMRFAEAGSAGSGYPPALGENTAEVLADVLKLGDSEIQNLAKSGAIHLGKSSGALKRAG
jgi:CoA:oxalate CoA-transferase